MRFAILFTICFILIYIKQLKPPEIVEIDVVYTWVNGSDPKHIENLRKFSTKNQSSDTVGTNRYRDNDELKYSLRSIEKNANWVRKVWLVTNGQVPNWLDTTKVNVVKHSDIFLNQSHLPTFSSPAIEANIHRIKGLSNQFIYLNDDVFFGNEIHPEDFYSDHDGWKVYLSWDVPGCAEGCSDSYIGDGFCDSACNVAECDFDGGDCKGQSTAKDTCHKSCPSSWWSDKFCDSGCNRVECAFDGGDCGLKNIKEHIKNEYNVTVDESTPSMIFNISSIGEVVTSGYHNNPSIVRSASISSTLHILALTFYKVKTDLGDVKVVIKGKKKKLKIFIKFKKNNSSNSLKNTTIIEKAGERKLQFFSQIHLIKEVGHPKIVKYSTKEYYEEQKKKFLRRNKFNQHFKSTLKSTSKTRSSVGGRQLLIDKFGASLIHVNHLLNDEFGRISRKVPAHMPHFIDKRIMEKIERKWESQFNKTSSNRFRSEDDMQYSFTYFYYIMQKYNEKNLNELFFEFDKNGNGILDEYEIQLMAYSLWKNKVELEGIKPETEKMKKKYLKIVMKKIYQTIKYSSSTRPDLLSFIQSDLTEFLPKKRQKYKYQFMTLDEVAFDMVRDDNREVNSQLDNIRYKLPKFVCLNDDMNKTSPNEKVVKTLHQFYNWYFPKISKFELRKGQRNKYLYIDDFEKPTFLFEKILTNFGILLIMALEFLILMK